MIYSHPLFQLGVIATDRGIRSISFNPDTVCLQQEHSIKQTQYLNQLKQELDLYFSQQLTTFTVPLDITGTPFQCTVWQALRHIPYGQIVTYQDIGDAISQPKACQAIGQANKKNPLPILIPCHRVIGKNGKLTGYMGHSSEGLMIKEYLLSLEKNAKNEEVSS